MRKNKCDLQLINKESNYSKNDNQLNMMTGNIYIKPQNYLTNAIFNQNNK